MRVGGRLKVRAAVSGDDPSPPGARAGSPVRAGDGAGALAVKGGTVPGASWGAGVAGVAGVAGAPGGAGVPLRGRGR
jgi:hypothetical protein